MATVTTPFDATSGQKLTASQWDSQVRDVLLWLMGDGTSGVFPRLHATQATPQTLPDAAGTFTLIVFDAEVYDTDTMHNPSSNASRITFTTAGLYEVNAQVSFTTQATYTTCSLRVNLNSGGSAGTGTLRTQPYAGTSGTAGAFIFYRYFNAGDYIEVFVAQASGATRDTTTTTLGTRVFARWIAVA